MSKRPKTIQQTIKPLIIAILERHFINDDQLANELANAIARYITAIDSPNISAIVDKAIDRKKQLAQPPGNMAWPHDIRAYGEAFASKFGRDPMRKEIGYWIKIFREKYVPTGITIEDLKKAYDICKGEGLTIKSPDSIFFKADELHRNKYTVRKAVKVYGEEPPVSNR